MSGRATLPPNWNAKPDRLLDADAFKASFHAAWIIKLKMHKLMLWMTHGQNRTRRFPYNFFGNTAN